MSRRELQNPNAYRKSDLRERPVFECGFKTKAYANGGQMAQNVNKAKHGEVGTWIDHPSDRPLFQLYWHALVESSGIFESFNVSKGSRKGKYTLFVSICISFFYAIVGDRFFVKFPSTLKGRMIFYSRPSGTARGISWTHSYSPG